VNEIHRRLGVSKSSVSRWVRDVELGEEARARLVAHSRRGPLLTAERKAAAARTRRLAWQQDGRALAHEASSDYVAGCMLYWGEGAKSRNAVRLTNSDPEMLAYFLRFLREHFDVDDRRVRLACNLFSDHQLRQDEIEQHWLSRLDLPQTCLATSTVNTYSKYSQRKRVNKLPYGTASLSVNDTRIVQTIYGSIQEVAGFERPQWLD